MTGVLITVIATLVIGTLAALRWRYAIVTVHGVSMEPALRDGDRVLVRRCGAGRLRTGQFVVFREPNPDGRARRLPASLTGANQENWVIKRVAAVPGEPVPEVARSAAGTATVPPRSVVVLGDAGVGCDSRLWGLIPASHVLGTGTIRPAVGAPGRSRSRPGPGPGPGPGSGSPQRRTSARGSQ